METHSEESLKTPQTELGMEIHGKGPDPDASSDRRIGPTTRRCDGI